MCKFYNRHVFFNNSISSITIIFNTASLFRQIYSYFSPNSLISHSSKRSSRVQVSVTLGSVILGDSGRFLSRKPLLWGVYFSNVQKKANKVILGFSYFSISIKVFTFQQPKSMQYR